MKGIMYVRVSTKEQVERGVIALKKVFVEQGIIK